jgi:4,5-dihydroxyphthalate decarboxylase
VRRLFADSRGEEERYFARTRIFPIMHVVVMHRRVYEGNRWIARELMKAFDAAKKLAYEELSKTVSLSITLPFIREEYERALATMGVDYWPYGLSDNADVLSTFIRYAHEQGLVERAPEPEELFAPEAGKHFVI